jgi:hypothetical protein
LGKMIASSHTPLSERLTLLSSVFASSQKSLLKNEENQSNDQLDEVIEEAAHAALGGDQNAIKVVCAVVESSQLLCTLYRILLKSITDILSDDALGTVLALCSTTIIDSANDLLSSASMTRSAPKGALDIFASYGKEHTASIAQSDVLCLALVKIHHLARLLPRLHQEGFDSQPAQSIWQMTETLASQETTSLRAKITASLADLIIDTSCLIR